MNVPYKSSEEVRLEIPGESARWNRGGRSLQALSCGKSKKKEWKGGYWEGKQIFQSPLVILGWLFMCNGQLSHLSQGLPEYILKAAMAYFIKCNKLFLEWCVKIEK